jgi:hypothetical protein
MIFRQGLVTNDDFSDCNDEIIVAAGIDFIGRQLIYVYYLRGEGVFIMGSPNKYGYSRSSISSSMAGERKSGIEGDEFVSYTVPDDATADILSLIQMCFGLVLEHWILRLVQCFEVDCWIWHIDCTHFVV